ncbi:MAG: ABC transporter ATP-binding protein [Chloroflexi bacterium]|nr:ABC transporter ATP-binding protein [Chloroflexota bacterium]
MATKTQQKPEAPRGLSGNMDEIFLGNVLDITVVRRLVRYSMAYRGTTIAVVFGMLGYISAVVAQPLIIAWGIDGFITAGPDEDRWGSLGIVSLIFFGDTLLLGVSQFIQFRSLSRLSTNILYDVRDDMFTHLQKQSTTFFDHNEVGRIMSRVQNDVLALQEWMEMSIPTVGDVFLLGAIIVAMLVADTQMAALALAPAPLMILTMFIWQRKAKPTFIRIRAAISVVNANLQEGITGVRVAQSMNRQAENLRRFDTLNRAHRDAAVHGGFLSGMLMPPIEMISMTSVGIVVVFGGLRVYDGLLEVGVLFAFVMFLLRFFEPIRLMTMEFTQFQKAMASGARIFELLDIEPDMHDPADAATLPEVQGRIEFRDVTFGYVPGIPVLNHINLVIEPGESVAFVGLTGAGKTSLASLVQRFYDVTDGQVLIDGIDVRDVSRKSLASQMSMVLQEPFLYSESVRANIRFNHADVTDEQIEAAATAVGAHDFIVKMPDGYDTVLEQRGANLSMGQRALVSMARAIVSDPRILMLDEATANMDSDTEHKLQEALRVVLKGRTSLLIAHRLSTITGADKIVVLEHGNLVEVGKHQELLDQGGVYAGLYAMNFGEDPTLSV